MRINPRSWEAGPVNRTGGVDRKRVAVKMTDAIERARAKAPKVANAVIGRIDTPPEESSESIVTNDAIQAINDLAGSPFMITVSLSAPHAPWQIGEPYYSMYPRDKIELPANRHSFEPADKRIAARRVRRSSRRAGPARVRCDPLCNDLDGRLEHRAFARRARR